MIDIYTLKLSDITPPNLLEDTTVNAAAQALTPEIQRLSRDSLEPLILSRIDELPEHVIDFLAWQLHVDFYDLAGTLTMKREAVKGSILWHMHKGTQWAIIEALRQIDISAEFVHWHDDNSQPYTFKLKTVISGDFYRTKGRDKLIASIRRAVNESKAARSYMAGLETRMEFKEHSQLFIGTAPLLSGNYRLSLDKPTFPEDTTLYAALANALQGHSRILLDHETLPPTKLYYANIRLINHDINIGVDLSTMQELLLQFERRILARIDAYEQDTIRFINAKQSETNARLDAILDLMRWKGADEAL